MEVKKLRTDKLEFCDRCRVRRRGLHVTTVNRYKEAYESGQILPPLVVFNEPGTERFIVASGNHRLKAAQELGKKTLECEVHQGDEVDALRYALGTNAEHGAPRTNEDIEYAFKQLMDHPVLSEEFRTNQAKADVLRTSTRTIQRFMALWREREGGDEAAKARARERAAARTPNRIQNKPVSDWQGNAQGMTDAVEESHRGVTETLTRDTEAWDIEDEHAFAELANAWEDATERARQAFIEEKLADVD